MIQYLDTINFCMSALIHIQDGIMQLNYFYLYETQSLILPSFLIKLSQNWMSRTQIVMLAVLGTYLGGIQESKAKGLDFL